MATSRTSQSKNHRSCISCTRNDSKSNPYGTRQWRFWQVSRFHVKFRYSLLNNRKRKFIFSYSFFFLVTMKKMMNMPWIWIQTWIGICLNFNQLFVYFIHSVLISFLWDFYLHFVWFHEIFKFLWDFYLHICLIFCC